MPAVYAHNKYGKLVLKKIPEKFRKVVQKYPRSFRVGLQGPDFLFFYKCFYKNNVNQLGVQIHHTPCKVFIENAIDVIKKYGVSSSQFSYILGFICHFALDSTCHPYVNKFMDETSCGHIEIEGDLEFALLDKDGFSPESYPIGKLIPIDYYTAASIAPFYPEIDVDTIMSALKWMKSIKTALVSTTPLKQTTIEGLMKAVGQYKRTKGHMIYPERNKKCCRQTTYLQHLLYNSADFATELIMNFYDSLRGEELSSLYNLDFSGR